MKVVALSGGVGGAKLSEGLARALPEEDLTIIVNTGDDFEHLGLRVCPDLDTVVYALAGVANPDTGWGRASESWTFMQELAILGGPTWFRLGDKDLAMHLERTRLLKQGLPLSRVVDRLRKRLGVEVRVLPMSDDPVATMVECRSGRLSFQEYFVKQHCEPEVSGFRFEGADRSSPAPGVLDALSQAMAVVLCPSNPWVSLDPILAVPGIRQALKQKAVIGVSPLVGGRALKGPAAKMYLELGITPSAGAVAKHYRGLLSGFVIDDIDAGLECELTDMGLQVLVTDIVMKAPEDRLSLAKEVLHLGRQILEGRS